MFPLLSMDVAIESSFCNLTFLAAISSFKRQVEALSDLQQWIELLIRLLCAVPGWSEKNVQAIKASPVFL